VEPEELVESQNAYADLRVQEDREVSLVLTLLTREILSREADIRSAMLALAHFDLVMARARYARDYRFTRAEVGAGQLVLKDARHPLLLVQARVVARNQGHDERESVDRAVSSVVPLDVRLLGDFHCLVITGPNTGGKTVALKTVGLIVLLTQSGLFVPVAPGSSLPVFDGVHADIGDEQSLEQSLSTFSSHMSRIARILREATPRSLVLLDELGAGTDPLEGGALGEALLEVFHRTGVACIVTTHLSALKEFAYQHARAENACMEFDTESLRPTYRLLLGQPGRSNALLIARRLGLAREVCDRAVELLGDDDRRTEEVIAAMERSRRDLDSRRQTMEEDVRAARDVRLSAEKELEEARSREMTLSREAEHEIDSAVRELRRRLEPLLARLRSAPRPLDELATELESILDEALRRSKLDEKRRTYALGLKKEDTVYLPRYGQTGRVRKVDRGREVVSVRVGSLVVEVPFSDVSWIEVDRSR